MFNTMTALVTLSIAAANGAALEEPPRSLGTGGQAILELEGCFPRPTPPPADVFLQAVTGERAQASVPYGGGGQCGDYTVNFTQTLNDTRHGFVLVWVAPLPLKLADCARNHLAAEAWGQLLTGKWVRIPDTWKAEAGAWDVEVGCQLNLEVVEFTPERPSPYKAIRVSGRAWSEGPQGSVQRPVLIGAFSSSTF